MVEDEEIISRGDFISSQSKLLNESARWNNFSRSNTLFRFYSRENRKLIVDRLLHLQDELPRYAVEVPFRDADVTDPRLWVKAYVWEEVINKVVAAQIIQFWIVFPSADEATLFRLKQKG